MDSYDLAMETIQESRTHAKLSDLVTYFEQLNQENYDDCAC